MRIIIALLLALSTTLSCAGCGQAKPSTAPEKLLEWEIEDFVQQHANRGGKYTDYNYTVSHSPDKETNTDTVDIELTVKYPYVTTVSNYNGVYQYDRQNEEWSLFRGGNWSKPDVKSYNLPDSFDAWMTIIEKLFPYNYGETIASTDLESFEVAEFLWGSDELNIDMDSLQKNMQNGFCINLMDNSAVTDSLDVVSFFLCFELKDMDYTERLFSSMLREAKRIALDCNYYISEESYGDNFSFLRMEDESITFSLFQVENYIYFAVSEDYYGEDYAAQIIKTLFESIGMIENNYSADIYDEALETDYSSNSSILGLWEDNYEGGSFEFYDDGTLLVTSSPQNFTGSVSSVYGEYTLYSDSQMEIGVQDQWYLVSYRIDGDYLTLSFQGEEHQLRRVIR